MANSNRSDGSCLSALGLCLRKRGKPRRGAPKSPISAAVLASQTECHSKPLSQTPEAGQRPALTMPQANDPASPSAKPPVSSSARDTDSAPSSVPTSEEQTSATDCSATTLGLWQEAYASVDQKTRDWLDSIPPVTDATDPIPELVDLVRSSENKHKGEALKLKVGNSEILWRDYSNRVVSVITAIGDIAINFAPAPSLMIWSAVRILLKTNVSERQDLVTIMGCTDMILCLFRRGKVYEEVYIGELPRPATQQDLTKKLVEVYTTCLEFLFFVNEQMNHGNLHRFLVALLDPGQGEQRVSAIKTLEKDLELAAHACEAQVSETHRKLLQSLERPLKRVDDNVAAVLERLQKRDREEAMACISTIPVGIHHLEKREKRTEGTCEWLINNARFREWENMACSSVFWLQGNIGTGKSFLSSNVIDRYWVHDGIAIQPPSPHDKGFAFFYCNSSDLARKTYDSIIRSYVRQLSEIPSHPESVHRTAYDLVQANNRIQNAISIGQCESALVEIINSYPRTTLILDAFDECDSTTKEQLARLFKGLVQKSDRLLKIFIASRPESEIKGHLKLLQTPQTLIRISTSDNIGDIEKYVTAEIQGWRNASFETKELVKVTLVEKSNGMFRWTYLQMEQLKKLSTQSDIRKRLGKLPKTLSEAYDEIYDKSLEAESERFILQRTVRWAMCARKPLKSSALLPAIRLESKKIGTEPVLDDSDLTEEIVEAICRHLVVRDTLGYWKFSHASVSEYFEAKKEPWVKQAKTEIAVIMIDCVVDCCLAFGSVWPPDEFLKPRGTDSWQINWKDWGEASTHQYPIRSTSDLRHPLQLYVQTHWSDYLREISTQDAGASDVTHALKRFLGERGPHQSSKVYQIFCHYVVSPFGEYSRFPHALKFYWVSQDILPGTNPLFGVVALGLHHLLDGWWDKDVDLVSMANNRGRDLLTIATSHGRTATCKDILNRKEWQSGINGDMEVIHQRALFESIWSKELDIFKLLLKKGANPTGLIEGQSLLCVALDSGSAYYSLLLENGADPNIECCSQNVFHGRSHGSALSRAANEGNYDAVATLISKGANVNLESLYPEEFYGNSLAAAVEGPKGNLECVRLLVEKGANVNADLRSGIFGSPLTAAIFYRRRIRPDCAAFLVEQGVDVTYHPKFGMFGSPLAAAVVQGDIDGARYLIDHGADVNAYLEFGEYGCALAAAILGTENLNMVKFLIEEQKADLSRLAFVRPRRRRTKNHHEPFGGQDLDRDQRFARKPDGMCFTKYWITEYAWPISLYLVREHHIEVQTLFSMGVPMDYIPPDLMSGG